MKKAIVTAMIAISMTGAAATPAMAADSKHENWIDLVSVGSFSAQTYVELVALLLPAVQIARS